MADSVEDILDEILMSDNDSETEQLVESAGPNGSLIYRKS